MTETDWLSCADPFVLYDFLRNETATYKTRWQGWVTTRRYPLSERMQRLFACACCARVAHHLPVPEALALLQKAEAFADGLVDAQQVEQAAEDYDATTRKQSRFSSPWYSFEREALKAVSLVHRTEAGGRLGALTAAARAWTDALVWQRHVDSLGGKLRLRPGDFAPLESVVQTCDRAFLATELAAETARQAGLLRDIVGNPFRAIAPDPAWTTWRDGLVVRLAQTIYDEKRFGDLPILADALEDAGCAEAEILSHCRSGGTHCRGCRIIDQLLGKG